MTANACPIVLVGNPRSGTTLLRLLLTVHKDICIPPEGPVFTVLEPKYGNKADLRPLVGAFLGDLSVVPKIETWKLDMARLEERLLSLDGSFASFIDAIYRQYMSQTNQADKPLWGDKSSTYTITSLAQIRGHFPNAFLINLVRDGRDVAVSYMAIRPNSSRYTPRLPQSPHNIARAWAHNLESVEKTYAAWPERQRHRVRYEDLVCDPERTLTDLCAALGVPYSPEMLNFHEHNRRDGLEPEEFLAWKAKTLEAVSPSQVGRWRQLLSAREVYLFESVAVDTLRRYGYTPFGPPPSVLARLDLALWRAAIGCRVLVGKARERLSGARAGSASSRNAPLR